MYNWFSIKTTEIREQDMWNMEKRMQSPASTKIKQSKTIQETYDEMHPRI